MPETLVSCGFAWSFVAVRGRSPSRPTTWKTWSSVIVYVDCYCETSGSDLSIICVSVSCLLVNCSWELPVGLLIQWLSINIMSVSVCVCSTLYSPFFYTTVRPRPNLAHIFRWIWDWLSPKQNCQIPPRGVLGGTTNQKFGKCHKLSRKSWNTKLTPTPPHPRVGSFRGKN